MSEGGWGVTIPPKIDDVIYEWTLKLKWENLLALQGVNLLLLHQAHPTIRLQLSLHRFDFLIFEYLIWFILLLFSLQRKIGIEVRYFKMNKDMSMLLCLHMQLDISFSKLYI